MIFMAELRCPMCGKSNPPQTEVCQFCQARLTPLIISSSFDESEPGQPGESDDLSPAVDGAIPDWLDGLREDDEGPAEDNAQDAGVDSAEIWSPEEEQRLSSAFTFSPEEENLSDEDWLTRLTGQQESQPEDQTPVESEAAEDQDSAAFLGMEEFASDEEASDWLAEFQTSTLGLEEPAETSPSEDEQDIDASAGAERPHWLDLIRAQQQKENEQAGSLSPLEEENLESGARLGGEPAGEAGQSDWLSDIGMEEDEEALAIDAKDLPDWLAETGILQPGERAEAGQAFPGWMVESELSEEQPASEAEQSATDWGAGISTGGVGESREPRQDLPDWLTNIAEQDTDQSGLPEPVESEGGEDFSAEDEGGLPDWLTKLETTAAEPPSGSGVQALILDDDESLAKADAEDVEIAADQDISAVPDWLNQIAPQEEQAGGTTLAEGELEPDLAGAQLPSWLQAMRPVESAAPSAPAAEERAKMVEKVGPLAGLAGVLPAEPEYAHLSKPKSSLVKLQVSDSQQAHITLLENLLAEEGQAKPIVARSAITTQYFLRLLLALVIMVSVIAPLWLNRQFLPLPDPAGVPIEVLDFHRAVTGLPSGAPVLVAFDYEPSFSGELDAIATAALAEMADGGGQLVMVSTNPTGPVLAERFVAARLANTGASTINLGYIPGGAAGLLAFAQTPRDINPFDLRGTRVWETVPLASLEDVSDFAMVIVITENPDTARSWIEQVQPFLEDVGKPMLMVLSAQAEPMVRPYYEANPKQVNGMISGLAGGAAFESISRAEGTARLYWDAFGAGLIIAAALILLGGIASLVLALISKTNKSKVEGAL
jgi:hypothetical protein